MPKPPRLPARRKPAARPRQALAVPEPSPYQDLDCIGCGVSVGRVRLRYLKRKNLVLCDACLAVVRRILTTMKARGYPMTDFFAGQFAELPGQPAARALPQRAGSGPRISHDGTLLRVGPIVRVGPAE